MNSSVSEPESLQLLQQYNTVTDTNDHESNPDSIDDPTHNLQFFIVSGNDSEPWDESQLKGGMSRSDYDNMNIQELYTKEYDPVLFYYSRAKARDVDYDDLPPWPNPFNPIRLRFPDDLEFTDFVPKPESELVTVPKKRKIVPNIFHKKRGPKPKPVTKTTYLKNKNRAFKGPLLCLAPLQTPNGIEFQPLPSWL